MLSVTMRIVCAYALCWWEVLVESPAFFLYGHFTCSVLLEGLIGHGLAARRLGVRHVVVIQIVSITGSIDRHCRRRVYAARKPHNQQLTRSDRRMNLKIEPLTTGS